MESRIGIIGAGWAGASTAHRLAEAGVAAEVFEKTDVVGGHSRSETMDGVVYEPNGTHVFHTSDSEVAAFVQQFGLTRPYAHAVSTEVLLSEPDGAIGLRAERTDPSFRPPVTLSLRRFIRITSRDVNRRGQLAYAGTPEHYARTAARLIA